MTAYTPGPIIDLADAKAHLRITSSGTDTELDLYLAAVTQVIEERVGPVVPRQFSQIATASDTIVLNKAPVVTVDSITTVYGQPGAVAPTYWLDPATGLLRLTWSMGQPIGGFSQIEGWYRPLEDLRLTITYTAGRDPVPASIQLAARIILEELWSARRAAGPLPARGQDTGQVSVPGGYGLPDSAVELLRPFTRGTRVG